MSYEKKIGFIGVKKGKTKETIDKMISFLQHFKLFVKWDEETHGVVVNDLAKALYFLKHPKEAKKLHETKSRIIKPW